MPKSAPPAEESVQVKAAFCKTCSGWIILSVMPGAETRKESIKEFTACAKAGDTIKIIPLREAHRLRNKCMCYTKKTTS